MSECNTPAANTRAEADDDVASAADTSQEPDLVESPHDAAHERPVGLSARLADETGAQALEYAMLGGAGVASVTFVTWLMRQRWFADAMEGLLSGLIETLSRRITDLLPVLGGVG